MDDYIKLSTAKSELGAPYKSEELANTQVAQGLNAASRALNNHTQVDKALLALEELVAKAECAFGWDYDDFDRKWVDERAAAVRAALKSLAQEKKAAPNMFKSEYIFGPMEPLGITPLIRKFRLE